MMKKNNLILLIIMVLAAILATGNVKAEEDKCSSTDLNTLRQEAANVKAAYVPKTIREGTEDPETETPAMAHVLDLKVYNVTDNMILKYEYSGNKIESGEFTRTYSNIGDDGAITVRQRSTDGVVVNYVITVMASYGSCSGQTLKTIRVTLPFYNYYSQLDACSGIQDYYLCQPYITTEVASADFYDKIESYKAKLLENKAVDTDEDNNSVVGTAFAGVKKYKYLIVGGIVAVGVVATVLILRRKKSDVR